MAVLRVFIKFGEHVSICNCNVFSTSLFALVQRSRVWLQLLWVSTCEPTSAYGVFRLLTYFLLALCEATGCAPVHSS